MVLGEKHGTNYLPYTLIQVRGINRTILEHKFNTKQNNTPACWYPATRGDHLFYKVFVNTSPPTPKSYPLHVHRRRT